MHYHLGVIFLLLIIQRCDLHSLFYSEHVKRDWLTFQQPHQKHFYQITVQNSTGHVFVTSVNLLFHLNANLTLLSQTDIGPLPDHPQCPQNPTAPCDQRRSPTDNEPRLLLVVEHLQSLLLCGTLYGGLCQLRPIRNISQFSWIGPYEENVGYGVGKWLPSGLVVPPVADGLPPSLYIMTGSPGLQRTYKPDFVSSKIILKDDTGHPFFQYTWDLPEIQSAFHIKNWRKKNESSCEPFHYPYKVSMDPLLVTIFYDVGKPAVHTLSVFQKFEENILVIGRSDGFILKINVDTLTAITVNILKSESIMSTCAFDSTQQHIYFLTRNKVLKYPIDTCSTHETCFSCIIGSRGEARKCGWCKNRCSEPTACEDSFQNDTCSPVIYKVQPLKASTSGGTLIFITGDNFGDSFRINDTGVLLAGVSCQVLHWNNSRVACVANPGNATGLVKVSVSNGRHFSSNVIVYKVLGVGTYDEKFSYVTPKLFGLYPPKGPNSGGTNITLFGEHLDIGIAYRINIHMRDCTGTNVRENSISCFTPDVSKVRYNNDTVNIQIDSTIVNMDENDYNDSNFGVPLSKTFSFLSDPEVHKIRPGFTTMSGSINVTVEGLHLESVMEPKMVVHVPMRGSVYNISQPCWTDPAKQGTLMTCETPSLIDMDVATPSALRPLMSHVSFIMDGVRGPMDLPRTHESLVRVLYFPDPELDPFDHIQLVDPNDSLLTIKVR